MIGGTVCCNGRGVTLMKRFVRQFAIMMVVVLLFQMLPIGAGQLRPVLAASSAKVPVLLGRDQWTEDESLRTAYAKHYRAGDLMVAEVGTTPIHYKDANGKWKPITVGLSQLANGDFMSDLGSFKVHLTAKDKANQVRLELANGRTLTMAPDETTPQGTGDARFNPVAEGRSMRYKDREGRFEYEYQANPDGIKELITLKQRTAKSEWVFPLELSGLVLRDNGAGGFHLVDVESGEHVGMVPPPLVWDANREIPPDLKWTVSTTSSVVTLGLKIDPAWLADKSRKYPVVIDPSVVIAPKGADLMATSITTQNGISSGHPAVWDPNSLTSYLFYRNVPNIEQRPLVKFDLSTVPHGALIQSASVDINRPVYYSCSLWSPLDVHEITQPWNAGATWSQPMGSGTSWTTEGGTHNAQSYGDLAAGSVSVKSLVQGWVNRTKVNNGVMIRMTTRESTYYYPDKANCYGYIQNPTLQVVYQQDLLPPSVALSGLAAGGQVNGPVSVSVSANDSTNAVSRVELVVDGTVVAEQTNQSSAPVFTASLTLDPRHAGPGQHMVSAAAYDYAGNRATTVPITIQVTIPEEPRSLAAQPAATGTLLTWEVPADGKAVRYNVYRSSTATLAPPLADRIAVGVASSPYSDTGLTGSKQENYYYAVTAVDAAGKESRPALAMAAFPFAPGQPVFNPGTSMLTWPASPRPGVTYKVYRVDRATGAAAVLMASGLSVTTYTVTQAHSSSVIYRVAAVDGSVESSPSPDSVLSTTSAAGLTARNLGGGAAELTWPSYPAGVGLQLRRRDYTGWWSDVAYVTATTKYTHTAAGTGSWEYGLFKSGEVYPVATASVLITAEPFPATKPDARDTSEQLTATQTGQIALNWEPSITPGVTYSIYRNEQGPGVTAGAFKATAAARIASGLTGIAFTDSANLLGGSGLDQGAVGAIPAKWSPASLGGYIDTTAKKYGTGSAKFTRSSADIGKPQSLTQTVELLQTQLDPVTVSGWSKAAGVTAVSGDYAVTVQLVTAGGQPAGGGQLTFSPGTHDWELRAQTIKPTAVPARAIVTVQLTGSATGTAWFDGIQLQPGSTATAWVEGPVLPGHLYLYQVEAVAPNGKTSGSALVSSFSRSWPLPTNGDGPALGLDGRWGFADLAIPGGSAYLNLSTGNLVVTATDSVVPGPKLAQVFRRTYNSLGSSGAGPLGTRAWSLNTIQTLEETAPGEVTLVEGDGSRLVFRLKDGAYVAPPSVWMTLTSVTGTYAWRIERRDGIVYEFDRVTVNGQTQNRLRRMSEPNGNAILYTYDAGGALVSVGSPAVGSASLIYDAGRLKEIRDAAGRVVKYGYDAGGRLTTVTDPANLNLTYSYDSAGRIITITDAGGRAVQFTYDGQGRVSSYTWRGVAGTTTFTYQSGAGLYLTTVTDPLGRSSQFITNATGNLLTVRDALGNKTHYQYDNLQRMVQVTNPRGLGTSITYNGQTPQVKSVTQWVDDPIVTTYTDYGPYDKPGIVTDPMNTQTSMDYDAAGNLLVQTVGYGTPLASTTTFTYKPDGMPMSVTGPLGNTTTYEVDTAGRVTAIINPLGGRTQMTYDAAGNLISSRDPNGSETHMQYDALGRQTAIRYGDGGVATFSYDRSGNLVEQVAPGNIRTTYQYDPAGRLVSTTDNAGAITRYSYDQVGNLILTTLPNGSMTRQEYDELGRVIKTYDGVNLNADGTPVSGAHFTEHRYDVTGNLTAVRLPSGYTATAEYDLLNRVSKVVEPPNTTSYTYDKMGHTLTVRDGNGSWTRYAYDLLGQLVQVYDAMNLDAAGQPKSGALSTSYEYNKAGQRTTVTIQRTGTVSEKTTTQYNALGLPTAVTDPLDYTSRTEYDTAGRVTRTVDRNGSETLYEYDPMGRPSRVRYADESIDTTFVYDAAGRRKSAACSCGVSHYTYDAAGRLSEELTPDGAIQYQYDAAGLRTGMKLIQQGQVEWSVTYRYDRANRLQMVIDGAGSVTSMRYGPAGELAEVYHPFGVKETITTDPATNRMTGRSYYEPWKGTTKSYSYRYDAAGNITSRDGAVYQYDANNRLISEGVYVEGSGTWFYTGYTYDAAGNRLTTTSGSSQTTYEYGSGGQLLRSTDSQGKVTQYSYNPEGHLIQQNNPDGTSVQYTYNSRGLLTKTQEGTKFTYNQYDVEGRRVSRRVTKTGTGGVEIPNESVRFQYDGIDVVAVRDAANTLKMAYGRMPGGRLLSWFAPGMELTPVPQEMQSRQAYENRGIFLLDHLGSVISLLDSNGEVTGYTYDAFGNVTGQLGNAPNELKFTGAPMDSNGLVHLGARFYKPSVGRFITQDTYKGSPWQPWTQNLYVYVGNNPVNYVDPSGHARSALIHEFVDNWIPGYWLYDCFVADQCTISDLKSMDSGLQQLGYTLLNAPFIIAESGIVAIGCVYTGGEKRGLCKDFSAKEQSEDSVQVEMEDGSKVTITADDKTGYVTIVHSDGTVTVVDPKTGKIIVPENLNDPGGEGESSR